MQTASTFLTVGFLVLTLLTAGAAVALYGWSLRSVRAGVTGGLVLAAWLMLTYAAAARGLVRFEPLPPTFFLFLVVAVALTLTFALSRRGRRVALGAPLAALVGLQAFRLPLELLMHRAYEEGVMPVQMSFSGRNFDIITGSSAILVAITVAVAGARLRRAAAMIWNVVGFSLLVNIVTVAMLSTPTPLRYFHNEPANVWVTHAPFVWLAMFLVPLALMGHVLVFRRLRAEAREQAGVSASDPAYSV